MAGLSQNMMDSNEDMSTAVVLLFVAILINFVWLIFMRKRLIDKSIAADKENITPSDFCLIGRNMRFKNYSPDGIKKQIHEHFEKTFGITNIVYINPVYQVDDIY